MWTPSAKNRFNALVKKYPGLKSIEQRIIAQNKAKYKNMTLITDAKPQFEKILEHLAQELGSIRTGRATPALVENLDIEAYGAHQPLKALASISIPDSKTVQIEPWDQGVVKSIELAIQNSDVGISPTVDGKTLRLNIPMMTEENRQRMGKSND